MTQWFSDSIKEQLENKDADLLDQIVDYIDFYEEDGESYDNGIKAVVNYLSEGLNKKGSKKISEDFGTDVSNIEGMVDAVLDFLYEYDYNALCDDGAFDSETMNFDPDFVESIYNSIENKDDELADNLDEIIDTLSAGERYDGKIDDIIDYIRGSYNGGERFRAMAIKKSSNESYGSAFRKVINAYKDIMERSNISHYSYTDDRCTPYGGIRFQLEWDGDLSEDKVINALENKFYGVRASEGFGRDWDHYVMVFVDEKACNESLSEDTTNASGMKRVNITDFDKMCLKEVFPKVKELVKDIQKELGSGNYETDDINGIVSAVASKVFECVTDELAKYYSGNKTNESLDEAYKDIDLNDYKDTIIGALALAQEYSKVEGPIMDDISHLYSIIKNDEYARRIGKNVDDWDDNDYDNYNDYELDKKEKEIDDLYDEYGRLRNESMQNESKKKETPKEAKCDEDEECDIDSPDDEM